MIPTMNDEWWRVNMVNGGHTCLVVTSMTSPLAGADCRIDRNLTGSFRAPGSRPRASTRNTLITLIPIHYIQLIHFDSFRFICALWFRIKCGYWSYSVTDQHFMRFQHLIVSSTLHGTSTSSPEDARLAAIADLKSVKNLWQRSKIQSAFVWMVWDGLGWSEAVPLLALNSSCFFLKIHRWPISDWHTSSIASNSFRCILTISKL